MKYFIISLIISGIVIKYSTSSAQENQPKYDVFSFEHGLDLLDVLEVHDGAAADPEKFFGVKLCFQRIQGIAHDMGFPAEMNGKVVAGGFDRVNLRGFQNDDLILGLHRQFG